MMNPDEKFNANTPKVVHESIDGEVVVVNLEQGDYFSLVKVGADIWDGLMRGLSRGDIVSEIIQRYEGEHTIIENAVNHLIEQLQKEELIVLHTGDEVDSHNNPNDPTPTIANLEKLKFEPPSLQKYTDMEELLALDPIHEVDEQIGWPSAKVEV
ncbi:PqqD family protein [Planktothrix sp. FACHB-1365]|uniref:PqqD family protein n=1 Tax=Planktothrix sp. FACHB-1365 TaxID=2692855 RepID=UPI001F54D156|nr:PqqD family protein [Planktothrix sp. FACHB-1365]